jgi:archaellum component FlaC
MSTRKIGATKEDLQNFKEEIVHEFHIISEGVISQVKQVAKGVVNVNEKLERFREEIKENVENRFGTLAQPIKSVGDKVEKTRQELKTEIQETRQEVLAAIKFS